MFENAYEGKRVFVTGHTGFKGSWLCEWLLMLGADVAGLSLPPESSEALFVKLGLAGRVRHQTGDVRDLENFRDAIFRFAPDYVFHLAAQPLVRASYERPVETFGTNIMGTVHVLEALRALGKPCAAVIVTTDKCYENLETGRAYQETDRLGGRDPYSASKAAAELVIEAYRRAFLSEPGGPAVASARAGNVLGGGDWAVDRIVPDAVRALSLGEEISVRNPGSTRPWQHVLEPLGGYLLLGARLAEQPEVFNTAFNFGPDPESNRTVAELVEEILRHWPGKWRDCSDPAAPHEARLLQLATDKARDVLGWRPVWGFSETIAKTIEWYRASEAVAITRRQIEDYGRDAAAKGLTSN